MCASHPACQEQCQTQLTCTNSTNSHLPSQRTPANTTLKRESRLRIGLTLGRGNEPEAPSSCLGKEACIAAPALWDPSLATPELCLVPAAGVGTGGIFSASLGSLPWLLWWYTGIDMSRFHPFTSRFLHKRMGA